LVNLENSCAKKIAIESTFKTFLRGGDQGPPCKKGTKTIKTQEGRGKRKKEIRLAGKGSETGQEVRT